MFVTMSATNTTESATNMTESATKPANDSATKDAGKANNITATIKDEVGGDGGKVWR